MAGCVGGEIGMSAYKRIRGKSKLQCQIESIEATQIDLRSKVRWVFYKNEGFNQGLMTEKIIT